MGPNIDETVHVQYIYHMDIWQRTETGLFCVVWEKVTWKQRWTTLSWVSAQCGKVGKTAQVAHKFSSSDVPSAIPVKSTDFGGSLPIFLPLPANLPIYHNLPISTDFFADLPNFNFFCRTFMYLWWKVLHHIINIIYSTLQGVGIFCI